MTPETLANETMAYAAAEATIEQLRSCEALVKAGAKFEIDRRHVPHIQVDGRWRTDESTGSQVIVRLRCDRTGAWAIRTIEQPLTAKQAKAVAKELIAEFRDRVTSVKLMRSVERINRY